MTCICMYICTHIHTYAIISYLRDRDGWLPL